MSFTPDETDWLLSARDQIATDCGCDQPCPHELHDCECMMQAVDRLDLPKRRVPVTRRLVGLIALASCAGPRSERWAPSIEVIRAWLDRLAPELPKFITALSASGRIQPEGAQLLLIQAQSIQEIDARLAQITPDQVAMAIDDLGTVLDALLSLVPATAPFVPVLMTLRALLVAYLRGQELPIPPPPPPTPQELQDLKIKTAA